MAFRTKTLLVTLLLLANFLAVSLAATLVVVTTEEQKSMGMSIQENALEKRKKKGSGSSAKGSSSGAVGMVEADVAMVVAVPVLVVGWVLGGF